MLCGVTISVGLEVGGARGIVRMYVPVLGRARSEILAGVLELPWYSLIPLRPSEAFGIHRNRVVSHWNRVCVLAPTRGSVNVPIMIPGTVTDKERERERVCGKPIAPINSNTLYK